jgi:hypothetical protein
MSGAVTKIPQIIYEQGGRRVVPYGIYQVVGTTVLVYCAYILDDF